jgi:hypothetical protein
MKRTITDIQEDIYGLRKEKRKYWSGRMSNDKSNRDLINLHLKNLKNELLREKRKVKK